MSDTPLDKAHAVMDASPDADAARLTFFERLADGEVFLLLKDEAVGGTVDPQVFDIADGRFVLIFDREHRMTEFVGASAPYAALSGRSVAQLLAGKGVGLGLNLEVAPSSILIPPDAVDWLSEVLAARPVESSGIPSEIRPPAGIPETLIHALDTKLAASAGLATSAYLTGVTWNDGRRGHLLSYIDALPGAESTLANATGEALIFSGLDTGDLDVAFFRASEAVCAKLAKAGLRFDLPAVRQPAAPKPPGMDPDRPPKLI